MTRLASSLRAAGLLAATAAVLAIALGQGEAAAQADPSGEVRALRAEVDRLSARVTALDAMLVKQGRSITLSGGRGDRELILRAASDVPTGISIDRFDAVLRFGRITLIGDEISLNAKRSIDLKAATIRLDGLIEAKGDRDIILKGSKIGGN